MLSLYHTLWAIKPYVSIYNDILFSISLINLAGFSLDVLFLV